MNDHEREICSRLSRFRRELSVSQKALAQAVGISKNKMVSIEYGRTPLRFSIAVSVCQSLRMSHQWLATGAGDPRDFVPLLNDLLTQVPQNLLFSKAFTHYVRPVMQQHWNFAAARFSAATDLITRQEAEIDLLFELGNLSPVEAAHLLLSEHLQPALEVIPPSLYLDFRNRLEAEIEAFRRKHSAAIQRNAQRANEKANRASQNKSLYKDSEFRRCDGVTNDFNFSELLRALKRLTAQRGRKAALAKELSISQASLSEWLRGVSEPGGSVTLRLLQWVRSSEASQTKSPGSATNTTRAQTRKKNSHENKFKSSPP